MWRWEIIAPDGSLVPTGSADTEAPFKRWAIRNAKRFLAKHLKSLEAKQRA